MDREPTDSEIVQRLADHEKAVGQLYLAYAERFPDHKEFWTKLADEEQQHADWLGRLLIRVQEGLGCVRREKFDGAAVEDSIRRVNRLMEEARRPAFSASDALRTAMTIEKSMIEAEYFAVFEGHQAEVIQVQYYLADAIRDHRKQIQRMISSQG